MSEVRTLLRTVIDASGLSRRKAFAAIREGRVAVDGMPRTQPSEAYEGGPLTLDGSPLAPDGAEKVYLLLNKPPGFMSTRSDERGRRTVFDLVPQALRATGLHSIGRLDRDTSGLLLLTNDGDLTFALTHPSHEVEKEYWLRLARAGYRGADGCSEERRGGRSGGAAAGEDEAPGGQRRIRAFGDDPGGPQAPGAADVRGGWGEGDPAAPDTRGFVDARLLAGGRGASPDGGGG